MSEQTLFKAKMDFVEKEFWTQFLRLYRHLPALWRTKSLEYTDAKAKAAAYDILVCKLRERYPMADKAMVMSKVKHFRTVYRRCQRKVLHGKLDASNITLWYYPLLTFLENPVSPAIPDEETEPNISYEERIPDTYEDTIQTNGTVNEIVVPQKPSLYEEKVPVNCYTPLQEHEEVGKEDKLTQPEKRKITEEDPLIRLPWHQLSAKNSNESSEDHYTKAWAAELKEMQPIQCKIAKKIFSDVVFHGSIGNLETSHIVEIQNILNRRIYGSPPSQSVGDEGKDTSSFDKEY